MVFLSLLAGCAGSTSDQVRPTAPKIQVQDLEPVDYSGVCDGAEVLIDPGYLSSHEQTEDLAFALLSIVLDSDRKGVYHLADHNLNKLHRPHYIDESITFSGDAPMRVTCSFVKVDDEVNLRLAGAMPLADLSGLQDEIPGGIAGLF